MTPQLKHRVYVTETGPRRKSTAASSALGEERRGEEGRGEGRIEEVTLPRITAACYSVGHFLNDATASCWFSYLLLYLEQARGLNGIESGIVLFCGQFFDALATPVVGLLSDWSTGIRWLKLGRRKAFNFVGVLIVVVCFFFVFGMCIPCLVETEPSTLHKTIAFAIFASLFNVGWASVQVSHMCMVPELTNDEGERVMLNSARYAFTVLANVFVFIAMWIILHFYDNGNEDNKYNPEVYSILTYCVIAFGGLLSFVFLVGTKEKYDGAVEETSGHPKYQRLEDEKLSNADTNTQPARARRNSEPATTADGNNELVAQQQVRKPALPRAESLGAVRPTVMRWRDWLTLLDFYKVAMVYMFTRLATNVSQVYLTFFVTTCLSMDQTAIAIVPLLVYISSLIATIAMKKIDRRLGRRNTMTLGAIFFAAACTIMVFLKPSSSSIMYPAVILLGIGSAITMVVSVSLEADLVGRNVESAAFLYGAISLTDKLSNGLAILGIQYIGNGIQDEDSHSTFIRYVNAIIPAVSIGLAVIVAWTIKFPKHLRGQPAQGSIQQEKPTQTRLSRFSEFLRSESNLNKVSPNNSEAEEDLRSALLTI